MNFAIERLKELYPDKIIKNISQYKNLYYSLTCEAASFNKSLKKYVSEAGYTYGNDATILSLEAEVEEALKKLGQPVLNASLLNQNHIYSNITRIASFYGITIRIYIEELGYNYVKIATNESNIDYDTSKRLKEKFNFTLEEIGAIVGVSRQRIEQVLSKGKDTGKSWRTMDVSIVSDTFEYMIKNHIFETNINETHFIIRHNLKEEVCLVWYDDFTQHCSFTEDISDSLNKIIAQEKMNSYFLEDYQLLEEIQVVNRLKKPYIKVNNVSLFNKSKKKHQLSSDEYAQFLGYEGYITEKDVNIDRRFIEFFENNMIDGEVYISSDPANQWIKSFASRSGLSIDEFVELFGYKKAGRGKFATLEAYVEQERETFKSELQEIKVDGKVQPQGSLYQRLNIFAKKYSLTMDELIKELGFERKRGRRVDYVLQSRKIIENDLDELNRDIEKALKCEREFSETVERQIHLVSRNMNLVARLKSIYGCKCQLCTEEEWMPIQKEDGILYSEVHHIIPLAEGKNEEETLDVLGNMIVVCPNHHKMLHFHLGGYRDIMQKDGSMYFVNEKGNKLPIIDNYHLKSINL